jgi:putative membrane protein
VRVPLGVRLIIAWLINAVALWVADWLFDGVDIDGWGALLLAAAVLAVVNTFVKPILTILSIPLILITLGFFLLLINIGILALTSWIVGGFDISGFWTYVGTVFVVWLVNSVLEALTEVRES